MPVDDSFTKFLLHCDGPDGSTSFPDEAGNTVTAVGNAQIDTAQSKFGGASGLFDGAGDRLTVPDSADWLLDGGSDANEWTIDFWVRHNGDPGTSIMGYVGQVTDGSNIWTFRLNNNNLQFIVVASGTTTINIQNAWNPAGDTWYHVACVKQGVTGYKMFVDGTQVGSTQTDTSTLPNLTGVLQPAGGSAEQGEFSGWMDEIRISKGIARWTANFTPPNVPYGPVTSGFFLFFS